MALPKPLITSSPSSAIKMIPKPKSEIRRFLRFTMVGLVNTIVDFGVLNLLAGKLKLQIVPSQTISFITSVIVSFFLSRAVVYPEAGKNRTSLQMTKFIVINLIGLGIRSLMLPWLNRLFQVSFQGIELFGLTSEFLSRNAAWAISTSIVILLNFFGNRVWTFQIQPDKERR